MSPLSLLYLSLDFPESSFIHCFSRFSEVSDSTEIQDLARLAGF